MSVAEIVVPIAWAACVQAAAWSVGEPIRRWLLRGGQTSGGAAGDAFLSTALGLVTLGNLAFFVGALGGLHSWLLLAVIVIAAAGGAAALYRAWPWPRLRVLPQDVPLGIAVAWALAYLPKALYPVLEHDDNVYHLLLPRLYLEHHGLFAMPLNLYANMPHLVELLYTFPMASGDFVAAKVFVYLTTFWIFVGLFAAVRPRGGRMAAGIACLLYLSGRNVQWHVGIAYVEPIVSLFLLGALLSLLLWIETRNRGYLFVLGLLCGGACGSKYTGWLFAASILLVQIVAVYRSGGTLAQRMRPVLVTLAIVAALVVPWLVKNELWADNPIYPVAYGVFGGINWSEIQASQLVLSEHDEGGPHKDVASYLVLPYRLVTAQHRFFSCPAFSMSLMALFLASLFLPSAWRRYGGVVQATALLGFLAWAFTAQQGRFLVAWVPVMIVAAMLALEPLAEKTAALGALAAAVIGIAVAQIALLPYPTNPSLDVFRVPRAEIVKRNLTYPLCDVLNQVVPPDGKVAGFWENRFYFLERPFAADTNWESPAMLAKLRELDDPGKFADELRREGFTHVVVNPRVSVLYFGNKMTFDLVDETLYPPAQLERDRALLSEFVEQELEKVPAKGDWVIFRIRRAS